MKVYVLTHCAAEENYTPAVYFDKAKARAALKADYDENLNNAKAVGAVFDTYFDDIDDNFASITYTDDTYDVYQLFEVEAE